MTVDFTFSITSPRHGVSIVTAPERFRREIEEVNWYIHKDPKRSIGRQFEVMAYVSRKAPRLRLHQLIWKLTGQSLHGRVDHKDGQPLNNSEDNLRLSTHSQNLQNRNTLNKNNSSGVRGVSWMESSGKWKVQVSKDGKRKYLGLFDTPEEAAVVRDEATRSLHGEFFVPGKISEVGYAKTL